MLKFVLNVVSTAVLATVTLSELPGAGAQATSSTVAPAGPNSGIVDAADVDAKPADTLTQYGITWTFGRSCTVGRYVTGDWWVVGPVTVTSITPQGKSGRNGSVVNPHAGNDQGYDDRISNYNAGLAATIPLELRPEQSLVTTASVDEVGIKTRETQPMQYARGALRTAAVLTCVAKAPPPGAFRPAFVGDSKPVFNAKQLQRDVLPKLRLPLAAKAPDRRKLERALERIWLDHKAGWTGRYMHPLENMPDYGRDMTDVVSTASMDLMLDDPNNELLLIRFVQLGIDNYGVAQSNPHIWTADGGHDSGRKMPILFAGVLLGHAGMQHVNADFAEDQQTYYGQGYRGQKVLWRINATEARQHEELPPEKWHGAPFKDDNDGWKSEAYRGLNGPTWVGECLAARLIGAKTLWNHDAFFDYVDRWVAEASDGTVDPKTLKPAPYVPSATFSKNMWSAYRAKADQVANNAGVRRGTP